MNVERAQGMARKMMWSSAERARDLAVAAMVVVLLAGCERGAVERYRRDLGSPNVMAKNQAIARLGELRVKPAAEALAGLLDPTQSKETRLLAARALGKIGQPDAVPALLNVLAEDDSDLRIAAAEAVGKIGDPRAVQPLVAQTTQTNVQLTAIWALGNIRCRESVAALTGLMNSSDRFVRYNARQSLTRIGNLE